jgi:hypothetical protein
MAMSSAEMLNQARRQGITVGGSAWNRAAEENKRNQGFTVRPTPAPTPAPVAAPVVDPRVTPGYPDSPIRREAALDPWQQAVYEQGMGRLGGLIEGGGASGGGMTGLERMKANLAAGWRPPDNRFATGKPTAGVTAPVTVAPTGDLISQGESVLSQTLQGISPEYMENLFMEKYYPGQKRFLEEETLPGVRESMVDAGDFWSTGRANLETKAREKHAERMEGQLADLMMRGRDEAIAGLGRVGDISGMRQRQEIERLQSALPWLNLQTQIAYGEPVTPESASGGRRTVTTTPTGQVPASTRGTYRPMTV